MPRTAPPWETKRKTLEKNRDVTDPRYGCKPEERIAADIIRYGIVNLDKPAGPTSHEVAAWTKKILKLQSIGHGGTLDPNVTGVLPITLEESTKVVQALLYSGKEYICVMKLHGDVQEKHVKRVLAEFEDEIYQRPPLRASVKRQLRTRRIYYIDYLETEGRNALFKVGCEGGTYIRKLCYDIGEVLGVGAHMQELRRTRTARFTEKESVILHDLKDAFVFWKEDHDEGPIRAAVRPMEALLSHLPAVVIRDGAVDAVCHGARLAGPGLVALDSGISKGDRVAVFTAKGEGVALGAAEMSSDTMMETNQGIAVTPDRILMPTGTYPKGWKTADARTGRPAAPGSH